MGHSTNPQNPLVKAQSHKKIQTSKILRKNVWFDLMAFSEVTAIIRQFFFAELLPMNIG
jgi:hypothetical protein